MTRPDRSHFLPYLFLALLVLLVLAQTAHAGMHVQIVDAHTILSRSTSIVDGFDYRFTTDAGVEVPFTLDAMDSRFAARGGVFHVFPESVVRRVLAEIDPIADIELSITVYLLPGMPTEISDPHTIDIEIFLPPASERWSDGLAGYVFMHELGHAVQNHLVPSRSGEAWDRFLELRELSDSKVYNEAAQHADRPSEIFAEDFRVLFGGRVATRIGRIENTHLPAPQGIHGLRGFMSELLGGGQASGTATLLASSTPNAEQLNALCAPPRRR